MCISWTNKEITTVNVHGATTKTIFNIIIPFFGSYQNFIIIIITLHHCLLGKTSLLFNFFVNHVYLMIDDVDGRNMQQC